MSGFPSKFMIFSFPKVSISSTKSSNSLYDDAVIKLFERSRCIKVVETGCNFFSISLILLLDKIRILRFLSWVNGGIYNVRRIIILITSVSQLFDKSNSTRELRLSCTLAI